MTTRRFPVAWYAEKTIDGYVVRDARGQALIYLYSREDEAEALRAKVLTDEEAHRLALNIAELSPNLGDGRGQAAAV